MQQSHRFSYLASDISKPGGSSSHIVDQVLGLILLTNTNVVHGVDHGVVLLRILLIEDLLFRLASLSTCVSLILLGRENDSFLLF